VEHKCSHLFETWDTEGRLSIEDVHSTCYLVRAPSVWQRCQAHLMMKMFICSET
jgi:hypothetical protein